MNSRGVAKLAKRGGLKIRSLTGSTPVAPILAALLLAGCAAFQSHTVTPYVVDNIPRGFCAHHENKNTLLEPPSRMEVCREEDGKLVYFPGDASGTDLLSQFSGPLGAVTNHVTIPVVSP